MKQKGGRTCSAWHEDRGSGASETRDKMLGCTHGTRALQGECVKGQTAAAMVTWLEGNSRQEIGTLRHGKSGKHGGDAKHHDFQLLSIEFLGEVGEETRGGTRLRTLSLAS